MRSIRRSRSAAGVLAVALLIAASGCAGDPAKEQASLPAPDATDTANAPGATTSTDTLEPVPTVTSTAVAVSAPFDGMLEESEYVPVQWLVPWDDGYLATAIRTPPELLPDQLPPEVAALFPPEVTALFPDGLPPTLDEATDILREAGLLDDVIDILNEHPDAMDTVQSEPQPGPALIASWSADGDSWMPIEVTTPDALGEISQLAVAGDRLTLAGTTPPDENGGPSIATVASTTDLENWNTATFPLTQPEGLPEPGQVWTHLTAVAADDEHWVVLVMVETVVDPTSGSSSSQPRTEVWSGAWGGEPALSDAGQWSWILLATSDGFLGLGEGATFSPDGRTWTDVPRQAPNVLYQAAAPMGDNVLAITGTTAGESPIIVLDASGTVVTEVEIPDLTNGFSMWSSMSSPAFIASATPPAPDAPTIVIEHDGFELTQEYGEVLTYRLVDLATGDVVVAESVDPRSTEMTEEGPFEHLVVDKSGDMSITDPETGATIVEIPSAAIIEAWDEVQGDDETVLGAPQPDLWLLATADAETWLVEDLDAGSTDGPPLVATNGTTVLVGTSGPAQGLDVWQRFSMTE